MTEPRESGCCRCCISFIFTSGLTALFLWLNLRPSAPICSIEDLSAFALNKTSNSTHSNHTVTYHLMLNNKNKDKAIYYDALNLAFYYKPNRSFPIENATFDAFHQGHQKKANRYGNFTPRGVNWENASAVVANESAVFRVELATAVRYKIIFWKTKRHRLMVGADLQVNDNGDLVKGKKKKGVKLSSGPAKRQGSFGVRGILGISGFVFVWLYL